jgi:hypothetical protein
MDSSLQSFFYSLFLSLHNITRWLVIVFAVLAIVRALRGWTRKQEWTRLDDRAGVLFTSMMDIQVLLGLILYFLFSPTTSQMFTNFRQEMTNSYTRFFGLEHALLLIVALGLTHVGRILSRKAQAEAARHRAAAIWFGFSILVVLAVIPWPFLSYGRPWLRLFGIVL